MAGTYYQARDKNNKTLGMMGRRRLIRFLLTILASLHFAIRIEVTGAFSTPASRLFSYCYCPVRLPLSPRPLWMIAEGAIESTSSANMELAWRYIKKPLLRLGSKGAAPSHGNSLRELLNKHIVVKVKVNNRKDSE